MRILLAAGLCLGLALPTLAQGDRENPTGSRVGRAKPADIPETANLSDTDRARITLDQFADCVVTDSPRKAVQYRDMKYDEPAAQQLLRDIISDDCLRYGELRMSTDLLRGAVFKNFYRREQQGGPKLGETAVDFATYLKDPKAPDSTRYLILLDFAGCIVRADPANVRAFVIAHPGSKSEKGALTALQPSLGPCFPSGAKVTFNKSILSAVLAEALYRETQAGQGTLAEVSR